VRKGISAPYTSAYRDGIPFDENTFLFRKNSAYNSSASQSNLLDQEFTFSNVTSLTGTDIGSTGVSGSNNYSGSTWTVNGSGGDLYGGNSTDAFRFAYTQMSGDGAFIAQISSIENTSSNAKAAIVIRESLSSNAKMAAVYGRAGNGYEFTSRGFDAADGSGGLGVSASSLPIWIKIERRGDNIVGYVGPDGVSWSAMQNTVFSMSNNYYIGLGVAANSNSELCTSVFTNVKVSSGYSSPGFDAFSQIEAEDYSGQSGIQTENTSDTGGGQNVGWIDDGDWLRFDDVDFDNGAESVDVRVASSSSGGTVEFRLGSTSGTLLGTAVVPVTGGWQT
ncbi:MAG: carbohydrate-binding protein, partial [Marinoscillum sp.]